MGPLAQVSLGPQHLREPETSTAMAACGTAGVTGKSSEDLVPGTRVTSPLPSMKFKVNAGPLQDSFKQPIPAVLMILLATGVLVPQERAVVHLSHLSKTSKEAATTKTASFPLFPGIFLSCLQATCC